MTYLTLSRAIPWASLIAVSSLLGCGRVTTDLAADLTEGGAPTCDAGATAVCDAGDPLPVALTGTFVVVEAGCRDSEPPVLDSEWIRLAALFIDPCGAAHTGVPDGYNSSGVVRPNGDGYLYESEAGVWDSNVGFAFTLQLSSEERAGAPVLHLRSATNPEPWEAWGVRSQQSNDALPTPPTVVACAVQESWTIHRFTGAAVGEQLGQGQGAIPPSDDPPRLEVGKPYTNALGEPSISSALRITDQHLNLPLSNYGNYHGIVTLWNGSIGAAHAGGGASCNEVDGEVQFEWDGETAATQVDWLLLDVDDLDGDGDLTDLIVRRTRTEWRPEACP